MDIETGKRIDWMKKKLGINDDTELLSTSLTVLHMILELKEEGFKTGGWKKDFFETEYVNIELPCQTFK